MLKENVEKVVESKVRPYLQSHDGDLEILSVEDGVVKIRLLGQCKNCISAKHTVEDVVETTLKKEIPEIEKVIVENYTSEEILDFARKILNKKA